MDDTGQRVQSEMQDAQQVVFSLKDVSNVLSRYVCTFFQVHSISKLWTMEIFSPHFSLEVVASHNCFSQNWGVWTIWWFSRKCIWGTQATLMRPWKTPTRPHDNVIHTAFQRNFTVTFKLVCTDIKFECIRFTNICQFSKFEFLFFYKNSV